MRSNQQISEIQLLHEINSLFTKFTELRMQEIDKPNHSSSNYPESFFESLVKNTLDIITVLHPDRTIKYINPAAEKILGYSSNQLFNQDFLTLIHPDEKKGIEEQFEVVLSESGNRFPIFKIRVKRDDGVWRTLQGVGQNLIDNKIVGGVLITTRDITEQQQLERQLQQAQKMESLGLIAGGIAHDFRNLMAVILGATQMIQLDPSEEEFNKYIEMISSSVERGKSITDRILAFARTDAPNVQTLNGTNYLENIREIAIHTLPKDVDVVIKPFEGDDEIVADPGQLQQVLLNLCINAADAMKNGGDITLSLFEPDRNTIQKFQPGSSQNYLCIAVEDTGVGMDSEIRKRIFEPFFTTKENGDGTGLGLSVAYSIMEQHNGWIDVRSTLGKGTTFILGLPKAEPVRKEPTFQPDVSEKKEAAEKHILLVEDEEHLRELLESIFINRGYHVSVAANGQDAFSIFQAQPENIDLIITDIRMPQMSGKQLQKKVQALSSDTKMIALTGSMGVNESRSITMEGFNAVVEKPFDIQDVLNNIKEVLSS